MFFLSLERDETFHLCVAIVVKKAGSIVIFFFEKFIRVRIYVFFFFFFGLSLNGSVNSGYKVSLYYFVMNVSRQCLLARG